MKKRKKRVMMTMMKKKKLVGRRAGRTAVYRTARHGTALPCPALYGACVARNEGDNDDAAAAIAGEGE